jgi:hypothetical protein
LTTKNDIGKVGNMKGGGHVLWASDTVPAGSVHAVVVRQKRLGRGFEAFRRDLRALLVRLRRVEVCANRETGVVMVEKREAKLVVRGINGTIYELPERLVRFKQAILARKARAGAVGAMGTRSRKSAGRHDLRFLCELAARIVQSKKFHLHRAQRSGVVGCMGRQQVIGYKH